MGALALGCGGRSADGGQSQSGPADPAHCSNLADQTAVAVGVLIQNQTSQPLNVGPERSSCDPTLNSPFTVATDAGVGVAAARACGNVTCSDLGSGHFKDFVCPNICLNGAGYIQLQPGEAHRSQWSPMQLVTYELPDQCLGESAALQRECTRAEQLPLGTSLRFEARASVALVCSSFAPCFPCSPDAAGGCTLTGSELGENRLSATFNLLLDQDSIAADADATPVTLVFRD